MSTGATGNSGASSNESAATSTASGNQSAASSTANAGSPGGLALVWAQADSGVIGAQGAIPWHLPEDLAHFRRLTTGAAVLMGRRTWDSLPERFRPLPGRRNLVLTRSLDWTAAGAEVVHALQDARLATSTEPLWIIGGGALYTEALPLASRLEVTEVDVRVAGDTHAPQIDDSWHLTAQSPWHTSTTGIRYRFSTHLR